ncbi:hypothetical protein FPHOBKDP_00158 [Listeria phage LPJP1]|nr:hypothetical protein FPHOBKDP_00158 [Listeria phage LPJP1]
MEIISNTYLSLSMGVLDSYKLNDIGEKEVGMQKDEFEEGDGDITNVYIKNYYKFILYNIQDTVLLMMIEKATKFLDLIYQISSLTHTRITKALKKTICLRNLTEIFYNNGGFVISNNHSSLYPKIDGKIKGAFVADSSKVHPIGIDIMGKKSNMIFDNVTDIDLTALYPHIIMALNISPESLIGNITFKQGNKNITESFIDDYNSNNPLQFCIKYYNLPNIKDALGMIRESIDSESMQEVGEL